MIIVNCWDRFCTLGRAPHTKETLADFHEWYRVTRHPRVVSGYPTSTSIPRVDGLSTDPLVLGRQSLVYELR